MEGTRRSHTFYPVHDPDLQARMHAVSFEGHYTYLPTKSSISSSLTIWATVTAPRHESSVLTSIERPMI